MFPICACARKETVGWIDVAIPGSIGVLLIVAPSLFTKSTGDAEKDASKSTKLRAVGVLLLIAAAIYLFVKLASPR